MQPVNPTCFSDLGAGFAAAAEEGGTQLQGAAPVVQPLFHHQHLVGPREHRRGDHRRTLPLPPLQGAQQPKSRAAEYTTSDVSRRVELSDFNTSDDITITRIWRRENLSVGSSYTCQGGRVEVGELGWASELGWVGQGEVSGFRMC